LYLEKGKALGEVMMTPEHRGAAPSAGYRLEFDIGEMGDPEYHVDVEHTKIAGGVGELRKGLKQLVKEEPGITTSAAGEQLEISKLRVKRLAERMGYDVRIKQKKGEAGRPAYRIFPQAG
jgi:hypothetical protein